jgi:hypothetical protein
MYVAGEPGKASDPVSIGARDPAAPDRLTVALQLVGAGDPAVLAGELDIVLG